MRIGSRLKGATRWSSQEFITPSVLNAVSSWATHHIIGSKAALIIIPAGVITGFGATLSNPGGPTGKGYNSCLLVRVAQERFQDHPQTRSDCC